MILGLKIEKDTVIGFDKDTDIGLRIDKVCQSLIMICGMRMDKDANTGLRTDKDTFLRIDKYWHRSEN